MINFNSFMPVEIIFGKNCVLSNKEKFSGYKKIFIVTGKSSAKLSGALGLENPELLPMLKKCLTGMFADFNTPIEKVKENIKILAGYHEKFDDETLRFYVSKVKAARNFTNSFRKVTTEDEMFDIYKKCVGK